MLGTAGRPLGGQRRRQTVQPNPRRLLPHLDQTRPIPVDLEEPIGEGRHRGIVEERPRTAPQPEPHLGIGERELRQSTGDVARFCTIRLQELAPGRHVVEEVANLDDGTHR